MSDSRRLEDLKRRVQQDPASIAFAALADEYRRAGLFHDAIETCRAGLLRHPAYLSARVTLGRALLELGEYEEAQTHLEQVLRSAPDNLAAIRALAELHDRRSEASLHAAMAAPAPAVPEPTPANDPAIESTPAAGPPSAAAAAPLAVAPLPMRADSAPLEIVRHEFTAEPPSEAPVQAATITPASPAPLAVDPACERLEEYLAAIERARASQDAQTSR